MFFRRSRGAKGIAAARSSFSARGGRLRSSSGKMLRVEFLEPRCLLAGNPLITEFMADNHTGIKDYYGNYSDWIEIFNPDTAAVNLTGWKLKDGGGTWQFPNNTVLTGGAYLKVFASGRDVSVAPNGELHSTIKLNDGGEYLGLLNPGGTAVSQYAPEFPDQYADVSYGLAMNPQGTTFIAAGASGKWLVPTGASGLPADWAAAGFNDGSWTTGTMALGYDISYSSGPTFFWGQFGAGNTWNLYEVVNASGTWLTAYNASLAKSQGGKTGHLVTIGSAAENAFINGLIGGDGWIGLTNDSSRFPGAKDTGRTSPGPDPGQGNVPGTGQQGEGYVWVTGEPFTYHNWDTNQPNNSGGAGFEYVRMTKSTALWNDRSGTETLPAYYVVEYETNLAAVPGPPANMAVLESHGASALGTVQDAVNLLDGGAGTITRYAAQFINYADPQNAGGGHYASNAVFGGNTAADDDNFALRVTGVIRIAAAGQYTFGVNSDDGFRLRIKGAAFTSVTGAGTTINGETMEYSGTRSSGDSLGVTSSLAVGDYEFELDYFDNVGGAQVEFFAALGARIAWDATNFKLVGDTANGGLALVRVGDVLASNPAFMAAAYNKNASAFVRIPFTVANPADITSLTLRMKYDDGVVIYLNGQEVEARNDPVTLAWNSAATADHFTGDAVRYEEFNLTDAKGLLFAGTNVLAIHVLNSSATDTNMLVAPVLEATTTTQAAADFRYFVLPTPGSVNGTGTADLGPVVTDVSCPAAPPAASSPIVVTAHIEQTANPIAAGSPTLHYRVMYNTEATVAMYDDGPAGGHGDATAGDGVYTGTIPGSTAAAGQMLRWYVTAADTLGNAGRWPLLVPLVGNDGGPEYVGTVIANPSLTSTLPIFQWFTANHGAAMTTSGTRASVFFLGEFYDNVFIRDRGGASTNGYKIKFNAGYDFRYAADQPRVDEFNLNLRGNMDDAYIRPVLGFETFADAGTLSCNSFAMRILENAAALNYNGTINNVGIFIEQVDNRYLERQGAYENGALYKMTSDQPQMNNVNAFEKKNRDEETTRADLQAFVNGIHLTGDARTRYLFDNIDIPAMIDYIVANTIVNDNDDAQKNYYLYRDTNDGASAVYNYANANGTDEWTMLPWDKDLTFGMHYFRTPYAATDPQTHPFFPDSEHPKADGPNAWNWFIDAMLDTPAIKEMYLRRLRSVMDELLQPLGTPYANRYYEQRLDELYAQLTGDPAILSSLGSISTAFSDLKTRYLDVRRVHLYIDHSVNTSYPDYAGIPAQQNGSPQINFGTYEVSPASGNQDEEYIQLVNPNSVAVDVSGWKLDGGVNYTFKEGVVIPAGATLYVSPNVKVFRARATGPAGNQGLFVQGNYSGRLSTWGETVTLVDGSGTVIATLTTPSQPSAAQQSLRVTEVMYHPADPPTGSPYGNSDFEYVEVKNVGATTVSLAGVKFDDGVYFNFTGSAVTSLAAGAKVLVVANQAAFQSRYGAGLNGIIAGQFGPPPGSTTPSRLDNGGEQIRLVDAAGETVLSFNYKDGWYTQTDGAGNSLVIRDASAADRTLWDQREGWAASQQANGSPGADETPQYAADVVVVNEVLSHADTATDPRGDWVEFYNPTASAIPVGGWYLSNDPQDLKKYQIAAGAVIPAGGYLAFNWRDHFGSTANPGCTTAFFFGEMGSAVYLTSAVGGVLTGYQVSEDFGPGDRMVTFGRYIKSTGGKDFVPMASQTYEAANGLPKVGPVVINEIMYHPGSGGDEYVELRNLTGTNQPLYDTAIPADTWKLTGGVSFTFPQGAYVPANGYALVVKMAPATFRTKYGISAAVPVYGPYDGALGNGGDTVELKKPGDPQPDGDVPYYRVDRVTYGDGGLWPVSADGRRASLNRDTAGAYGNDVINWTAGRGTPGAAYGAYDASAPSVPANLTAQAVSTTQINLSWSPASDPQSSVLCYNIYANGKRMASTTGTTFSDTWVGASVTYSYQVSAVNRDGIESALSAATPGIRSVAMSAASAPTSTTVKLTFSEALNRDLAQDRTHYQVAYSGIPWTILEAAVLPDLKSVQLTLASPLTQGLLYLATASGVITQSGFVLTPSLASQNFVYTPPGPAAVYVYREYWSNISGTAVSNLTSSAAYPYNPTGTSDVTGGYFEAPTDWADNYGTRMRAYVTAPQTGNYTFWIASDDNSELWLSTNDNPANKVKIAVVPGWTASRTWTTYPTPTTGQVSVPISLVAGQRYYIEALQKEGGGGDNLAVGWQLPDGTYERPIPVSRLTAYIPTPDTTVSIAATDPLASEIGPDKGRFTITRSGVTSYALTVYYTITGTASTADYQEGLTGTLVMPGGATTATLDITPVADGLIEPEETVKLTLLTDPRYYVGTAAATVVIDEAPTDIGLSPASVPENSPTDTVVGNLTSVDPNAGETFSYTLLNNAGGRFKIVGGQVRVANGTLLDYETATSHVITVRSADAAGMAVQKDITIAVTDVAEGVVGRRIFYNRSGFDGGDPAANAADDGAVATDKQALLPGGTATFANYTSYTRGINGVMVDLAGAANAAAITAADFTFRAGNDNTPGSWAAAQAPTSVTVRAGAGTGGSDRVTIIWADNAVENKWLQVTVRATTNTSLAADDVFCFGNAVGETGNDAANPVRLVDQDDELAVRSHKTGFAPTSIDNVYDFNRDRRVSASDELTSRYLATTFDTALKLISVPAAGMMATTAMAETSFTSPPVVTQVTPVAAVAVPVTTTTLAMTSAFVGPLPVLISKPTAIDVALALVSPVLPVATSVPLIAPLEQKGTPKIPALEAVAARVADTPTLDHLTLLLAMERSAAELSAQRHLRAIDAVLAEGLSGIADVPDAFAPARPMRRKMTSV